MTNSLILLVSKIKCRKKISNLSNSNDKCIICHLNTVSGLIMHASCISSIYCSSRKPHSELLKQLCESRGRRIWMLVVIWFENWATSCFLFQQLFARWVQRLCNRIWMVERQTATTLLNFFFVKQRMFWRQYHYHSPYHSVSNSQELDELF